MLLVMAYDPNASQMPPAQPGQPAAQPAAMPQQPVAQQPAAVAQPATAAQPAMDEMMQLQLRQVLALEAISKTLSTFAARQSGGPGL
jgi:hypothetical protein